ncbi:N-acetylmuramoyl-L-alanine amidase [Streptomyces gardneri]|uniref:peptidoglycan recognition protein family protein n=1 Tax=Streptomyces gardneri TaxID=66892 RepID=UPI0036AED00C
MAWYPGATRYELQPESDDQPAIRPTQFIVHSIIAPWTAKRVYEYWRDSTNLESHFGLGYEGDLGQFIGTETRADANYQANRRADGTGAVSIETASNLQGSDPWTPAQVEELIKLGVWLHQKHGIPLRICRTHDDPGFGYHRLHAEWAKDGTNCPGDARVKQFKEVVFPGIVARATSTEEDDDMTPEDRKLLTDTAAAVRRIEAALAQKPWTYKGKGDPRDMHQVVKDIDKSVRVTATTGMTPAQLDALVTKLSTRLATDLAARLAN